MEKFLPEGYAEDLVTHLRSRFHPGKPHIGTLGPIAPDQEDRDLSLETPFEDTESESLDESSKNNITFNFVPNHLAYGIRLSEQKTPTITKLSFYIRVGEGSDEDIENSDGRPEKYVITENELESAFRHYEVEISTKHNLEQTVRLFIDEKEISMEDPKFNSHVKVENKTDEKVGQLLMEISDYSDPFLVPFSERKMGLEQQKYKIVVSRTVTTSNGDYVVEVDLRNNSPLTRESVHPERKRSEDAGEPETEDDCVKRYVGAMEEKTLGSRWFPRLFNIKNESWAIGGNNFGRLLEVFLTESDIDSLTRPFSDERDLEKIVNAVYDDSELDYVDGRYKGTMKFEDHILFKEEIPMMKSGLSPKDLFSDLGMSKNFADRLEQKGYSKLHKFQEDCIYAIQQSLQKPNDSAVLLSARTGGGKTESFMIPIIDYCIKSIDKDENNIGAKALIFYPTKALANDQASRIISLLYEVNKSLKRKITIGMLHGDIPKSENDPKYDEAQMEGVPFACPACEDGTLVPKSKFEVFCNKCDEVLDFVYALTREPVYSNTPDIVITNPDTLQFDMMLKPSHHGIFGRQISVCEDCLESYSIKKNTCKKCSSKNISVKKPQPPKFVVFDEIHMFSGTFGINTSFFLSRLKHMIKKYSRRFHEIDSHKITFVGSSATISNSLDFSSLFFDLKEDAISLVPKDDETRSLYYLDEISQELKHRYHLFIMPYSFRPISTVAKSVGYLQGRQMNGMPPLPNMEKRQTHDKPLQILGFVNNLSDSTNLMDATQREFMGEMGYIQVSGHTTDFDKNQRSKAEKGFNRQEMHVLFATPTLEVGVDFRMVNCIVIFGFPFSFNEYVQRIGRGGRKDNSLIITVCQSWKPIDHYFYSDAKRKISEQHQNMEPIPLTRNNPDAIKKHLRASVFDMMSIWDDSEKNFEDLRLLEPELEANSQNLINDSMKHLSLTEEQMEEILPSIRQFTQDLKKDVTQVTTLNRKESLYKRFFEPATGYNDKYRMTDLRSTEPSVAVEISWDAVS